MITMYIYPSLTGWWTVKVEGEIIPNYYSELSAAYNNEAASRIHADCCILFPMLPKAVDISATIKRRVAWEGNQVTKVTFDVEMMPMSGYCLEEQPPSKVGFRTLSEAHAFVTQEVERLRKMRQDLLFGKRSD